MGRLARSAARLAVVVSVSVAAACGAEPAPPAADGGTAPDAGRSDAGAPPDERYLTRLESPADLAALTSSTAPVGVRYLARVEGATPVEPLTEPCYFQNMRRFPWHLQFLQSFPGLERVTMQVYLSWVTNPATRRLWGGAIQDHPAVLHPLTRAPGVLAYTIYADLSSLSVEDVAEVDRILRGCIPFAPSLLVFVSEGPDQDAFVIRERQNLQAQGIAAMRSSELVPGT
ncbi:MAG: hypothetical protein IT384_09535 [Deltaproteobacteria bacterium]|nr:hypothetical protein [Deltaproteobacteria bacterium]